jgi:hypothetical protein
MVFAFIKQLNRYTARCFVLINTANIMFVAVLLQDFCCGFAQEQVNVFELVDDV